MMKLFVILARKAPVGVIIRRGPSRWVQLIKWNTATDTFEHGQWFHGRVYEKRCDLSPDGTKLIYFAAKYNLRTANSDSTATWTAISKPPYWTALALWPHGYMASSGYGGGLFTANKRILLNWDQPDPRKDHMLPRRIKTIGRHGPFSNLYFTRLLRDGWLFPKGYGDGRGSGRKIVRLKFRENNALCLAATNVIFKGDSSEQEEYVLFNLSKEERIPLLDVGWADWDQRGRFVFARHGKLLSGRYTETGQLVLEELADFNQTQPTPIAAPEWARRW